MRSTEVRLIRTERIYGLIINNKKQKKENEKGVETPGPDHKNRQSEGFLIPLLATPGRDRAREKEGGGEERERVPVPVPRW